MLLSNVRQLARRIKRIYETNDPIEVMKRLGIIYSVFDKDDGDELPDGCYYMKDDFQYIKVKDELDEHTKRMVLAHELAHALLHRTINTLEQSKNPLSRTSRYEYEADVFSAEFLLDDEIFDVDNLEEINIYDIARENNVSIEYALLKREKFLPMI